MESKSIEVKGKFKYEIQRADGKIEGPFETQNTIVTVGKDALLNIALGATAKPTWYIGLFGDTGGTTIAAADTLASHAGWTEMANYDGRVEWTAGTASAKSITSADTVRLDINGTGTFKGIFLCTAASGTSGTLFSAVYAGSSTAVYDGDSIVVTAYTVTIS
jgi:hypothetical protein